MSCYMPLIRPRWRRLELPIPPTYNWNNPRYNRPGYRIRVRNVVPWIILLSTNDRKNELEWLLYWPWRIRARNKRDPNVVTPTWSFSSPSLALFPSFCPPSFRLFTLDAGVAWINNASVRTCESAKCARKDEASLTSSFRDVGEFFYFATNFYARKWSCEWSIHEFN